MLNNIRTLIRVVFVPLAFLLVNPQAMFAEGAEKHVVSPSELRQELAFAAESRRNNLRQVQDFFGSEPVREAMMNLPADSSKVERAVASLSDEELARLAETTEQIQEDVAAGALSNLHLTYIVIALAAAVLVLVLK